MIATTKKIININIIKDLIILSIPWTETNVFPGQFFMLGPESFEDKNFILNRPFSISDYNNGIAEFRIRIAGKFTKHLNTLKTDDKIRVIGPMGSYLDNGFYKKFKNVFLVGGGIGIAPMVYFYNYLNSININTTLLYGTKDVNSLHYLPSNLLNRTLIFTEDGSSGKKGFVTDFFKDSIPSNTIIIACGPQPMYNAVKKYIKKCEIYVLTEERMACGFGVCLGCVVNTVEGYKRVCKEGPLFPLDYLTNF